MAWYRNHYHCGDCGTDWEDEWSCCCDDECPECGSGDWSPTKSDNLTFQIEEDGEAVIIRMSSRNAEHTPNYAEVAIALSVSSAEAYVNMRAATYWD